MSGPDLNLLAILDVLLSEGSVVRAAKRLQLSASAMSRTLVRLRETTGDQQPEHVPGSAACPRAACRCPDTPCAKRLPTGACG